MITMKELGAPIRQWVPDWLGLICIFIVILPVTMLNGSYTGSMLEVSNTLGTNTEDITMGYYAAAADEYIRRLGAYCKFELIELPECRLPDDPNGTQIAAGLAREAEQIEAKLPRGAWFCVLTPEGTELSSEGLAERLQAEKLNGRSAACFLIGSSFGIDARIKRMADFRLSFSKMTFPHHLMRVMALEQLYRAESILAGTKYHK